MMKVEVRAMLSRWLGCLAGVGLLLTSGCGSSDEGAGEITESTWDVVILSDSYLADVAERYAEHVANANDVEVVLHNEWKRELSAEALTLELAEGAFGWGWPDLVRDAEVVVYLASPVGLVPEDQVENCGNGGGPIAESHCDDDWAAYQEALEQVPVEIKRLRDGQPTIIRAVEAYSPGIGRWDEAGVYEQCLACDTYAREAERAAADALGVPIAKVWDAFNGPDHTEDPVAKGYISSDGFHPSTQGAQVIADQLHDLGYAPTP